MAGTEKRPGKLVITDRGFKGRTYNGQKLIDGKVPVYLINEDFSPRLNRKTSQQIRLLCDPQKIKIIGFID